MVHLISTYLLQNRSVSIPGLGTIYIERTPAQSDYVNRQLMPPAYHYRFDRYFDAPGKEFFNFLSAQQNIPDYEAIKQFNEWALGLRNRISHAGQSANLEGIGSLIRDDAGMVIFEPAVKPRTYFISVPAERIIRTDNQHQILVGDKETTNIEMTDYLTGEQRKEKRSWWIYAVIIAAIAILAIFFHFYRNGWTSPFGNQQKIKVK